LLLKRKAEEGVNVSTMYIRMPGSSPSC
jgi:hypothetical protein